MPVTVTDRSTYALEVLRDNPLYYFTLGETSGNFVSSGGQTASATGVTYAQPNLVAGRSTSAGFGDSGVATLTGSTLNAFRQYADERSATVELWFKDVPAGTKTIWSQGDARIDVSTSGISVVLTTAAGTESVLYKVPAWDRIYHVILLYVNGTASLYVNGALVAALEKTAVFTSTNTSPSIQFGRVQRMQHVAVYNFALSEPRIQQHYERGRTTNLYDEVVTRALPDSYFKLIDEQVTNKVVLRDDIDFITLGEDATREVGEMDLDELTTIAASKIAWQGRGTITVEVSLDEGVTWTPATNNAPIPGLTGAGAGQTVRVRETLLATVDNESAIDWLEAVVYGAAAVEDTFLGDLIAFSSGVVLGEDESVIDSTRFKGATLNSGYLEFAVENARTIEFWVLQENTAASRYIASATGYALYYDVNGTWTRTGFQDIYVDGTAASGDAIGQGIWRHVVLTLPAAYTGTFYLFSNTAENAFNTGKLDNVAVYSRVLTAAEALEHFETGRYGRRALTISDTVNTFAVADGGFDLIGGSWTQ